jgi:DNA-binding transcriptional MerR regulator
MANYSIKDIEKLSGIKAHTLRIWEKRYQIIEPSRTGTNIRYYTDKDLKKILNVSILNRHGIKISKIAALTNSQINEKVLQVIREANDYNTQIENLVISMIEFSEEKFDKIITKLIINLGFEESIIKVIYPFFEKIGFLWQTETINPGQEHFVSNLVRQKLLSAVDNLIPEPNDQSKTFVLFLPEGELHEIGLLFFHYLLRKRGHETIYLGQTLPFEDLINVCAIKTADCIFTYFTNVFQDGKEVKKYILELSTTFPEKTIYLSGKQLNWLNKVNDLPKNTAIVSDPSHFVELIAR